ncbi:hypothetical protein SAMN04487910_4356 [Aquimarina amphilecti]|uniref:Uncharacterized protein n=1 Tax=Aquimarina amphilecti TaxID=1038014 RepID=A0A1H7WBE8_AQUAM|nr:hypothetical protein [Aquimarina amphilecti]SEM18415.1 hypothetical protein SAMN04487910_4356 [Aquimarina amphilecti]
MNKILLSVLTILLIQFASAQRTYMFDRLFEFSYQESLNLPKVKELVLTNSKNNDYYLLVQDDGKTDLKLYFHKRNNLQSTFYLDKKAFSEANRINLDCDLVERVRIKKRDLKYSKKFIFENLKDTIINDTVFNHILFKIKSKKHIPPKQRKVYDVHFITYKYKRQEYPFLGTNYVYLSWKQMINRDDFDLGIIKEQYAINRNGKQYIYRLVKFSNIENKYISVPEACDYSQ